MPTSTDAKKMYCPRCDRSYLASTEAKVLDKVKRHVQEQHPDHDPLWYETYPHAWEN